MSSIMTNASAMTALKSLQMTNKSLETTQARISTGFRVAEAADNAAYWSIATTMRSDNKAMGTVQDALGLGAAQVDVAYTAMDSVKDYLDQIKTKLVAASQPGVDKAKIQSEIDQLQEQLKGIADAASFSGSNWLSVDSSDSGYSSTQKIVSSFTRSSEGVVSIETIDIDITSTALFDTSATDGLLEGGTNAELSTADFTGVPADVDDGSTLTITIAVDGAAGVAYDVSVDDAETFDLDDIVSQLNDQLDGASAGRDGDKLVLMSHSTGTTSEIEITAVAGVLADGTTAWSGLGGLAAVAAANGAATGGDLLDIDISSAKSHEIDGYIRRVEGMLQNVTTAASDLGAVKSRIDMQKDFVTNLMAAVDRGVGALVDANMNEESTRLQALQVQQQLGIQALSIANGNAQSILALFRG